MMSVTAEEQVPKRLPELADECFRRKTFRPKTVREYRKYVSLYIETTSGDVSDLTLDSAMKWRFVLLGRSENVARLGTEALMTFAKWLAAAGHHHDPRRSRHRRPRRPGRRRGHSYWQRECWKCDPVRCAVSRDEPESEARLPRRDRA